ncbi:MAG TPA: inorganic phosphate transporter [Ktedonobacterales bacterium]|nr:inorganic phosphate transporter [Ktedonobacterales bacterium]
MPSLAASAPALAALSLAQGNPGHLIVLLVTIIVAVGFDFTNGFHDTANAVATSISTRVLTPRQAIVMAAVLNFVGAFISTNVAKTIGTDIASPAALTPMVVLAALVAAIGWNLITWYYGLPSSSSHALIGGLIGAAVVFAPTHFAVLDAGGILKVVLALILSPIVGMVVAFLVGTAAVWIFRRSSPHQVTATSTWLQRIAAAFVAFSHGSNDAQKTMGVITAALLAYEGVSVGKEFAVPIWVIVLCATAMGLGTSFGGWRIIRTMGMRTVKMRALDGFAAQASAAGVILSASAFGLPVSTTHVIAGSVMGVGARQRISAVRWGVAGNMVTAWILTGPITAVLAAVVVIVFHTVAAL